MSQSLPYPKPTSATATKKMRSNRRVDTKPETKLRSSLHKRGFRFRKDYPVRLADGRTVHPDIVFTSKKVAIFVDGCFWHSCPRHGTVPKSNRGYWVPKLQQNIARDRIADENLSALGWRVIRVWEHSVLEEAVATIQSHLVLDQSHASSGS